LIVVGALMAMGLKDVKVPFISAVSMRKGSSVSNSKTDDSL
jgi:hypothetical protein